MPTADLRPIADAFQRRVPDLFAELSDLVRSIPPGQVVTYGDLAKRLGDAVASRWVASYLLEPNGPLAAMSHRVIRGTGELGLYYTGDVNQKEQLLAGEGIVVRDGKIDLNTFRWELPVRSMPLVELKRWQQDFSLPPAEAIQLDQVQTIGGLDVSYAQDVAVAVCSILEADGKTVREITSHQMPATFPYISGYLAFREIPVYLELLAQLQAAGKLPDILLVDGNGKLHPRQMGIATMLGGLTGIPTIGVAKSQLCGILCEPQLDFGVWVAIAADKKHPDEILGYAYLPHAKTIHPLYISQGYAVEDVVMHDIVGRCFAGHRSPEPIYLADRESRRIASSI